MKKIAELEEENKIIADSLTKQNKIIKLVYDSLIEKQANEMVYCNIIFYRHLAINNTNNSLRLNSTYNGKIYFAEIHSGSAYSNCTLKYSLPSKERKFNKESNLKGSINSEDDFFNFSFMPKDTGWYYWNGNILLKNLRSGAVTSYPITDSFYVYK
ncbi:MAG: hypothetical protein IT271_03305 [Chitinophagales bacterium]|nr:hypothetical protein [Chitinophagales bacterium]